MLDDFFSQWKSFFCFLFHYTGVDEIKFYIDSFVHCTTWYDLLQFDPYLLRLLIFLLLQFRDNVFQFAIAV